MRAISLFFLTALLAPLPLKAEEQVYLMLFTSKTGHSAFPMKDTTHCEEEGEKWMSTAVKGISGGVKGFYCVNGSTYK